jgi:chemotaxis protein methyltransferase CheR
MSAPQTLTSASGSAPSHAGLSSAEFERFARLVHAECGIHLPPTKRVLLEGRLRRRLGALGLTSFAAYWNLLQSQQGHKQELVHMIDAVSTNKTDFFREPQHFAYLTEEVLPRLHAAIQGRRPVCVWSAACSTGEEPYTLAMVLEEFAEANPGFMHRITATDINTNVLQRAAKAVYRKERTVDVPRTLLRKYFLRSRDPKEQLVRVAPQLRGKVRFSRINLMDDAWDVAPTYDIIFCRNVLIYFDARTCEQVVRKLLARLEPGGNLFIGHSETLNNTGLPVRAERPTVYARTN